MPQGKSPECLSQAPDGGPKPQKYAQITTVVQNKQMRNREEARAAQLEAARKETAALSAEEVMERLKEVRSGGSILMWPVPQRFSPGGGTREKVGLEEDARCARTTHTDRLGPKSVGNWQPRPRRLRAAKSGQASNHTEAWAPMH